MSVRAIDVGVRFSRTTSNFTYDLYLLSRIRGDNPVNEKIMKFPVKMRLAKIAHRRLPEIETSLTALHDIPRALLTLPFTFYFVYCVLTLSRIATARSRARERELNKLAHVAKWPATLLMKSRSKRGKILVANVTRELDSYSLPSTRPLLHRKREREREECRAEQSIINPTDTRLEPTLRHRQI